MWVLKREPGGLPEYVTLNAEYTTGNTMNAWSGDRTIALGFADERSAQDFQKKFHHWFDYRVSVVELK